MIRDLNIKNYRCFEDFSVDGLAQVNLIVGDNNSGKTSLLEAIYLLLDKAYFSQFHKQKTALIDLLESRKEFLYEIKEKTNNANLIKRYLIQHFFHKYNIKKNIEISSNTNISRKMNIIYESDRRFLQGMYEELFDPNIDAFRVNHYLQRVTAEQKSETGKIFYVIDQKGDDTYQNLEDMYVTIGTLTETVIMYTPESIFIPINYDCLDNIEKHWDLIQLTPKEDKVIKALQIINPDIERIGFTVSQYTKQIRLKIKGEDQPIPLSSMGQGMNRILGLITTAVILENGVLLIDEIETGLHYKAQTDMWRLLIKTAQELNVQIFATTHSWDCICAYQEALEDIEDKSMAKLFRLDSKYGKLRAVEYKADEISIAVDQGIEVR
ncbi:MAG: ATP/GTP-binding protein [Crocosphaera sp.]